MIEYGLNCNLTSCGLVLSQFSPQSSIVIFDPPKIRTKIKLLRVLSKILVCRMCGMQPLNDFSFIQTIGGQKVAIEKFID